MQRHVTDYSLYRWRFLLGYTFIIFVIGIVIGVASLYVPGELRQAEIASSLRSGLLSVESIEPSMVIDLPYHILQRLSFMVFGVSIFSIKLPSIILGTLTVLGLFLLIRTWFRRNIAVITTILAITSVPFLFIMQDGTPNIMYSFLTIWTLFAATYVTRKKLFGTFWKVLTGVMMATALYSPLGIYLVIAVLTTAFFHPHIRYTIRKFSRPRLWVAVILGAASMVPLIYACIVDRATLFTLLGIPNGGVDVKHNIMTIFSLLTGFGSNDFHYLASPLYSIPFILLAAIGIYKLVTYKYTARSYITLTLLVFLLPLVIFNPERILYLFPVACLMLALGMATLITNWYKLFPRNPYARIAGLIPLSILVIGIAYSGVARYTNNYIYNHTILGEYSNDLRLINRQVALHANDGKVFVLVPKASLSFYQMTAKYDPRFIAVASTPQESGTIIADRDARNHASGELTQIVTSRFKEEADRLYIYKFTSK